MCEDVSVQGVGPNLLVGLKKMRLELPLPAELCLEARALGDTHERVHLVYGFSDSFKRAARLSDMRFCNAPILQWLARRQLQPDDL